MFSMPRLTGLSRRASTLWENLQTDDRVSRRALILLLVAALLPRLATAIAAPDAFFHNEQDAPFYVAAADSLLVDGTYEYQGKPISLIPPAYPLFLAGLYSVFGHGRLAVRLVQALLGTLTVFLCYLLGRELLEDRRAALLGAAAVALHPILIFWTAFHLTETLYITITTAFFVLMLRSFRGTSARWTVAAGGMFAASLLTRELMAPYFLAAVPTLWAAGQRNLKAIAGYLLVFLVGTAIVLGPWIARNYATFGRVIILTDRQKLYQEGSLEGYGFTEGEQPGDEEEVGPNVYNLYAPQMLSPGFVADDPANYARIVGLRFWELWLHPNGLQSIPSAVLQYVYIVLHTLVMLLSVGGVILAVKKGKQLSWLFILLFIYTTLLFVWVGVTRPRYALPLLPYLLIFAAYLFGEAIEAIRQKTRRPE